jgi:hypothetical protein
MIEIGPREFVSIYFTVLISLAVMVGFYYYIKDRIKNRKNW